MTYFVVNNPFTFVVQISDPCIVEYCEVCALGSGVQCEVCQVGYYLDVRTGKCIGNFLNKK